MTRGAASADGSKLTKSNKTSGATAYGTKETRPKLRRETPSPHSVENAKLNELLAGAEKKDVADEEEARLLWSPMRKQKKRNQLKRRIG